MCQHFRMVLYQIIFYPLASEFKETSLHVLFSVAFLNLPDQMHLIAHDHVREYFCPFLFCKQPQAVYDYFFVFVRLQ